MSEQKPKPPNAGKGRVKGVPNKVTADARIAFTRLLDWATPKMQSWLTRVAKKDPDRALDLVLKLSEFCIPRLGRIEHAGQVRHTFAEEMTDDELYEVLRNSGRSGDSAPAETQRTKDPRSVQ